MIKKGKFQIFSYLVDEKLIFYKDLSKKEVFLAFSIINTDIIKKKRDEYHSHFTPPAINGKKAHTQINNIGTISISRCS